MLEMAPDSLYKNSMKSTVRLAILSLFLAATGATAADVPAFLILRDGGSYADQVQAIQRAGARIRHRVPPRILIVDLPSGLRASSLPNVDSAYGSAVPVSILEAHGPTSVAAGLQWNRRLLTTAQTSNLASMGSLRQLVADRSLSAPGGLRATTADGRLICDWEGVDGAIFYELQASNSPYFDGTVVRTRVVRTQVEIVSPGTPAYIRVRAMDPGGAGTDDDVNGRWSDQIQLAPASASAESGSAPTLTSPANGLETEGFTLILEWTPTQGPARVQVSRNAGFTDIVFDEVAGGGEYACPGPALRVGDNLYWRVQSLDGHRSPWSSSREARIGEPRSRDIDAFVNPEAPR